MESFPIGTSSLSARVGQVAALLVCTCVAGCASLDRATLPATELPLRPAARAPEQPPQQPVPEQRSGGEVVHVLRSGQTLWSIARAYEVELDVLMRANGIEDPDRLEAGRALIVPGRSALRSVPPPERRGSQGSLASSFDWPVPGGSVLSGFGARRRGHSHKGIDIGGPIGRPVLAARAGRVVYSGSGMRGYGNTVILDHGGGWSSLYAHNSRLLVRVGTRVERGEPVAKIGRSGNASTEHCHFEIRHDGVPQDPLPYLTVLAETRR